MSNYMPHLKESLIALGARENVPLSELTSFRIGGNAAYVLIPTAYEQIIEALEACRKASYPVFLMGRGSNLLASDAGFSGLVIRFDRPIHPPVWDGEIVRVCAGTPLVQIAKASVDRGFAGLECLAGIPGTVGGACAMNAGAYGTEIKDVLRRLRVLANGEDRWIHADDEAFGYRKSSVSFPASIVLEVELKLRPDDGTARNRMADCLMQRRERQPLEFPSAGSVFKRPKGHFAGALIEQCGLKGFSVGDAQISKKHAGFIINRGAATEQDVSELIKTVQERVEAETGVRLECEIKRIGENPCI